MKTKKFLKFILPPMLISVLSFVVNYRKQKNPNILFDGDDFLFKQEMKKAKVYGEYGCGKSTKWVINNTNSQVISVDSSSYWVAKVKNDIQKNNGRLNLHYSDLGDIGEWGRPLNYLRHNNFSDYTDYIWSQKEKPNIVLVDGRFRVCCFLTTLKFADEGTMIFFDDYTIRPHYHFVEKYLLPVKECGRQCLFVVPSKTKFDINDLNKDISKFRYVFE